MSRDAGEPRPRRPKEDAPGDEDGPGTFRPKPARSGDPPRRTGTKKELRVESGGPNLFERVVFGRVSTGHLATFCRQFAAYLAAGVDLIRALESLRKQFHRTALGPVLGRMATAVRRGETLTDAASREPRAFDSLFVSLMRVAEARGGVPEVLKLLGAHYEARQRLIRQARSALIYPAIVLLTAAGVIAILVLFVFPRLIRGLELDRANLPAVTRALIAFAGFIERGGWLLIPALLVGGLFGLVAWYRTPAGKATLDVLALNVPVLGKLLRMIDTTRFARTLSTLLEAGVDVGTSLDLTADVVRTAPFRRAVRRARAAVVEGAELSESLDASRRFDADVIAVVSTGEETGKLPEGLARIADDYEERVEFMVKNLASLLQPIIIIALGGVVLFIILAVLLPYISWVLSMSRG